MNNPLHTYFPETDPGFKAFRDERADTLHLDIRVAPGTLDDLQLVRLYFAAQERIGNLTESQRGWLQMGPRGYTEARERTALKYARAASNWREDLEPLAAELSRRTLALPEFARFRVTV